MNSQSNDPENEWDSSRYDGSHSFVTEYGEDLIDLLDPGSRELILDLGCGTGHLTDRIADSAGRVVGLDRSRDMVVEARTNYPDREFIFADARQFAFGEPFDAVFSNATLHWIQDQDAVIESIADTLRPGGRFVAELGGAGNISSIVDALESALAKRGYNVQNPWYFPTVGEYASKLESFGFEVRYATLFDRPTELDDGARGLAGWIDMFGDSFFKHVSDDERRSVIADVEDELRDDFFEDGVWTADYRRLRVMAIAARTEP